MSEEMEYNGYWWFAESPEKKLCGVLKFVPGEGAVLNLSHVTNKYRLPLEDPTESYFEIIHGLSSDGKKITLYKCYMISSGFNSGEGEDLNYRCSFKSEYIFVGHHFKEEKEIKFKNICVKYSYLDEWVGELLELEKISTISRPSPISLTKKGDTRISINFSLSYPPSAFSKLVIEQDAYICIESLKSYKDWYEYEDLIRSIQFFLSLGVSQPVYPLKIEGKLRKDKKIYSVDEEFIGDYYIDFYPNVEIYVTYVKVRELKEDVNPFEMAFLYDNIKDERKRFLLNWLVNYSLFKSSYNTYFSTIYNKDLFLENRFLNIVMALEGYHRSRTDNLEIDEYSHEKRKKLIIKNTPEIYRKWLKLILKYSNEPNLRIRLSEILKPYTKDFKSKSRINSFINKVIDNRNKLVHKDEDKNIDYQQLAHTTEMLKVVFEVYLMEHMGFPKQNIKEFINKKKQKIYAFKYLKMID